jgi:hypothetical protein
MKYLILALALTGCAMMPQPYDNVLYDKYVISAVGLFNALNRCDDSPEAVVAEVRAATSTLNEALLYNKYHGDEKKLMDATETVRDDLNTFLKNYTGIEQQKSYCRLKIMIQEEALIDIVKAVGGKPQ